MLKECAAVFAEMFHSYKNTCFTAVNAAKGPELTAPDFKNANVGLCMHGKKTKKHGTSNHGNEKITGGM